VREKERERERESSSHCRKNESIISLLQRMKTEESVSHTVALPFRQKKKNYMETQIFHHAKIQSSKQSSKKETKILQDIIIRKILNSHLFWVKFTPFLHTSDYMQIKFECVCPTPLMSR